MFYRPENYRNWSKCEDGEVWSALQGGDRAALAELFSRYYSRLFRYGNKLISDREAVKDGIQELFLSLWRHRSGLSEAKSVEFYLLYSFRRILLKEKKKLSNQQGRNIKYSKDFLQYEFSIEDQIIYIETKEKKYKIYQRGLSALTDRQRESLQLRMEYGLDNREIAEVMNISEKRVRNLIYEATRELREYVASKAPSVLNMN
ncbi:MAG: sigma-70 family RNA polymerase sigma factor [Balneolaceae bacterium]|nr:sigma-70 family RNA polymerase sigma factor [Balneolaceae bacterium]